ncbi:Delta(8)-fatty-acid desaturase [Purpureocillium lavendulum]|uniref:Delta(8)-fatty-acid desaturase n=1 Tax=Purpureocillium lavendulum TaxID=1247861 RepID=A0AB34FRH1_9HYPO|nr:Delta(8)-fatty-acid desaturase [Purpureocillium lavendulum]
MFGAFSWAIILKFDDDVEWVFRSPRTDHVEISRDTSCRVLASEAATLRYLRQHTSIPVPDVHDFSTTFQCGIGVPYILMSKAPGIPLSTFRWQTACHDRAKTSGPKDSDRALTQNERSKIMEQLGRLMAQLSLLRFPTIGSLFEQDAGEYGIEECMSPGYVLHGRDELHGIGRGPFFEDHEHFSSLVSAFRSQAEELSMGYHILLAPTPAPREYRSFAEFYTAQMLWNDYAAVGDKTESSNNRLAYCIAATYLQDQVVPYLGVSRSNQGGFPLYHHDLSTQNIFVDEHFNITCIIDWAFASTVPHAQLYATPGLPHPRDLITDQKLVEAFRSGFTDDGKSSSTMLPGVAPESAHWKVGEAVSRFMLLVRFDALQDYPLLEELHTIIRGHITSEKESLQGPDSNIGRLDSEQDTCLPIRQCSDYTVGWICALSIELAASHAMLDCIHESLATEASDSNIYTLGSIGRHNIVLACLPENHYGTNSAAIVASNMLRSFPSICIRLMVGIGGGVPGNIDMRLGDIVVSHRVMQYDLGKVAGDGQFQRTAVPKMPPLPLSTAVSKLRAVHESEPSHVPSFLREMLEKHPEMTKYAHPGTQHDLLFRAEYNHDPIKETCNECHGSMLANRGPRKNCNPNIHYGGIASGNQVMKHGTTRDRLARELDVICFEMEAAGLMDHFPCLVIRGICDYSDSHKNKQWQEYAAAAAAAYAKELLSVIPAADINIMTTRSSTFSADPESLQERRRQLLDSLRFEQIDSRQSNIKGAHTTTCKWLLTHPDYLMWLDSAQLIEHYGFLWISGKPGAGKSTIMKFAYTTTKRRPDNNSATASFFFNARGELLERSTTGMYRSLLLQLLESFPDLQEVVDNLHVAPLDQNCRCPPLDILQGLFANAVSSLGQRSFTCFIDALDECDEQQVRDMVSFFEELGQMATECNVQLRICFSSRHYPYIYIRHGLRLKLEDESGHEEDLAKYVRGRLEADTGNSGPLVDDIRKTILEKATGVFMWVVLVVDILNKEFRKGRIPAVRKRLAEIPNELSDLFKDMLRRDNENMSDLLLCIQWILYGKRPLKREEFYCAMWSGISSEDLAACDFGDVTCDAMDRFVVSTSKGIAEVTKSKSYTVQFIHESVRDFLVKDNGLRDLWPELGDDVESISHESLKQCCQTYIELNMAACVPIRERLQEPGFDAVQAREAASEKVPFLEYAAQHVLYHANGAATRISQDRFLAQFPLSGWLNLVNMFERYKIRRYTSHASFLYILAEKGFSRLIRTRLDRDLDINILGERHRYPLFAALVNGHRDAVRALLGWGTPPPEGTDIADGLEYGKEHSVKKGKSPLLWAVHSGHDAVVEALIQRGANVDARNTSDGTIALVCAARNGHESSVRLLIDSGADVNAQDRSSHTALQMAAQNGHESSVRLLIDSGADVNAQDGSGHTALHWAAQNGHQAIVRLLIDRDTDVNAQDGSGHTALRMAAQNGHGPIVRLLIDSGANVDARYTPDGTIALVWAARNGHEAIVRLLSDRGTDVNAQDGSGHTALHWAAQNGHEATTLILIDSGADVNAKGRLDGSTALQWAAQAGHKAIMRMLIDSGADINVKDIYGRTVLQSAAQHGHEAIVRLLIHSDADVNAQDGSGHTALRMAAQNGHESSVRLLIDSGADINAQDGSGHTALRMAAQNGHGPIVRLLIDRGTDVNAQDGSGHTALHWAAQNGHQAIVRLLIDRGTDVNAQDGSGHTALHWAAQNGHQAIVRLLIDRGTDVNAQDGSGHTALHWAAQNGHEATTLILIDSGADVNAKGRLDGSTALQWAAQAGHKAIMRMLIDSGADINVKDIYGRTVLQSAAQHGHEAIVRLLIHSDADVNAQDGSGHTALRMAGLNGHGPIVRLLIHSGANVDAEDRWPLRMAMGLGIL